MVGFTGEILFTEDAAETDQNIMNAVVLTGHPDKNCYHCKL